MTGEPGTYKEDVVEMLFGSYFFLSNRKIEHHRNVMNILDATSQLGGLLSTVVGVFGGIGFFLNTRFFMGYLIKTIFGVNHRDAPELTLK